MFVKDNIPVYNYKRSSDQDLEYVAHHPLIVVGAGPVGLAAGLDAGVNRMNALLLDDNNTVSVGSRAVCYSKRFLEIMSRLGVANRMMAQGVTWNVGKVFFRDKLIRQFDLLPEDGHQFPAFINLQQYYLEEYMVDRIDELECVEIRWKNKVVAVQENADQISITVETPDGPYQLTCDWLIVADGAGSQIRSMMGLESKGQIFKDRFLIVDIVMKADFPTERWFAFEPSYHNGGSTLLHKQSDNVWRLDFQLGWDADPEQELKPENIIPRVKAMLGEDLDFDLEWSSVYTFTCRMMDKFRHARLLYVGDAAHQVSPFGARGANSGVQDTDNLIWKLKLVMEGKAPDCLLDSYSTERVYAAKENLMNSTRSTDFITPKSKLSKLFRDTVLELSREYNFAQSLINSGRLSDTAVLIDSDLCTNDESEFDSEVVPGSVLLDAPVIGDKGEQWLLSSLGNTFSLLCFADAEFLKKEQPLNVLLNTCQGSIKMDLLMVVSDDVVVEGVRKIFDSESKVFNRLDAKPGTIYLIRPDQHVAGRWRNLNPDKIERALKKACCV